MRSAPEEGGKQLDVAKPSEQVVQDRVQSVMRGYRIQDEAQKILPSKAPEGPKPSETARLIQARIEVLTNALQLLQQAELLFHQATLRPSNSVFANCEKSLDAPRKAGADVAHLEVRLKEMREGQALHEAKELFQQYAEFAEKGYPHPEKNKPHPANAIQVGGAIDTAKRLGADTTDLERQLKALHRQEMKIGALMTYTAITTGDKFDSHHLRNLEHYLHQAAKLGEELPDLNSALPEIREKCLRVKARKVAEEALSSLSWAKSDGSTSESEYYRCYSAFHDPVRAAIKAGADVEDLQSRGSRFGSEKAPRRSSRDDRR